MPDPIETLNAVLAAGEAAGYWHVLPNEYADDSDYSHMAHFRAVEDTAGRRFNISARDGKIRARVADLYERPRQRGVRALVSDRGRDVSPNPDASASVTRDPAAIARELHRRVVGHPDGQARADCVRAYLTERLQQRALLLANVERLRALGWRLPYTHGDENGSVSDTETYAVTMHGPQGVSARVDANGSMYVERVAITVDTAEAFVACLR